MCQGQALDQSDADGRSGTSPDVQTQPPFWGVELHDGETRLAQILVADAPGLVGAVLDYHEAFAGLVADGTLTGAHLDLTGAIKLLSPIARASLETPWREPHSGPVPQLRDRGHFGRLEAGMAHLNHLPDAAARP